MKIFLALNVTILQIHHSDWFGKLLSQVPNTPKVASYSNFFRRVQPANPYQVMYPVRQSLASSQPPNGNVPNGGSGALLGAGSAFGGIAGNTSTSIQRSLAAQQPPPADYDRETIEAYSRNRYTTQPLSDIAITPQGTLQADRVAPAEKVVGEFWGWWYGKVGNVGWWDKSVENVRVAFNEIMRGENPDSITWVEPSWYDTTRTMAGYPGQDCSDWLYAYRGDGCASFGEIEYVLQCYKNLVTGDGMAEYQALFSNATKDEIFNRVSTCSKVSVGRVGAIIRVAHALWASKPSTVNVAVMYPLAVERASKNDATPTDIDTLGSWFARARESVGGALSDIVDAVKWVLILGGGAVIAYFLYQLYVSSQGYTRGR